MRLAAAVLGMGLSCAGIGAMVHAQEDDEGLEPPVTIEPGPGGDVQSERRADGSMIYKVTKANGEVYCVRIIEPRPMDELDYPRQYRVPCN